MVKLISLVILMAFSLGVANLKSVPSITAICENTLNSPIPSSLSSFISVDTQIRLEPNYEVEEGLTYFVAHITPEFLAQSILVKFIKKHPDLARLYGFRLDEHAGTLKFLTAESMNKNSKTAIKFVDVPQGYILPIHFAEHLAQNQHPLSISSSHFYHDRLSDHIIGILTMPPAIVKLYMRRVQILTQLKVMPRFKNNLSAQTEIRLALESMVSTWDNATAIQGSHVAESSKAQFPNIFADSEHTLIHWPLNPYAMALQDLHITQSEIDDFLSTQDENPI